MEAFITGRSVISSSGTFAVPSHEDRISHENKLRSVTPTPSMDHLDSGGADGGAAAAATGTTGAGDGGDGDKPTIVLAERTSQLISSYKNYISGQDDEEMLRSRIYSEGGSGGNTTTTAKSNHTTSSESASYHAGASSNNGVQINPYTDAPLLREWNSRRSSSSGSNSPDLDMEDALNDSDYSYYDPTDCCQKKRRRRIRYSHPVFRSKKFKRFLLAVILVTAIIATVAIVGHTKKENALPDWDEELKEVLEEEEEDYVKEGQVEELQEMVVEVEQEEQVDEEQDEELQEEKIVDEQQQMVAQIVGESEELNHKTIGIATFEVKKEKEESAAEQMVEEVEEKASNSNANNKEDGDATPQEENDVSQASSSNANNKEEGDAIQDVSQQESTPPQESEELESSNPEQPSQDDTEDSQEEAPEEAQKQEETQEEGEEEAPVQISKASSSGPDAEALTRHILCCAPTPSATNTNTNIDVTTNAYNWSNNRAAEEYANAEAHRPRWFNRTTGWVGQTYQEALMFCTEQHVQGVEVEGGGEGGGSSNEEDHRMQLCPYEVYCPTGPHHIPLGGYRTDMDVNGSIDGDVSRSAISNYPNGWVEVGEHNACAQYTLLDPVMDAYGGSSEAKSKVDAMLDEIVSNQAATDEQQQQVQQGGGLAGTFNPMVKPGPAAITEELVAKANMEAASTAYGQVVSQKAPMSQQQQQSPPSSSSSSSSQTTNAYQYEASDISLTLHEKFKPLWLSGAEGWNGGSHADAIAFCKTIRNKTLCPYSAMCPHGPGHAVMGGRHQLEFNVDGEQYAPVLGGENHWVMIGTKGDEDGDVRARCMTHSQLEGKAPEWGLSGERGELKQHIMCCTVV